MFTDYWCHKCGKKLTSNLYKRERWPGDSWKPHWRERVDKAIEEHKCDA